jgi:small subunit ribosomal protein S16
VAVKIKLKRLGRTRVPTYRIVVADARTKRDGRAIEEIGKYHPKEEPSLIEVNSERAQHWLSVGAQPTPPVMTILKITGDWQKFKGEPGAEGTLRVREPATNKKETFAAALKEAGKDSPADSGATTPKGGGRAKKADSKASDTKAEAKATDTKAEAKEGSRRGKPKAGSADEAAGAVASSEASADDSAAAAATADVTPAEETTATADATPAEETTATADAAATADATASSEPGSEA